MIYQHIILCIPGQNPEIVYPTIYKIMVFYWIILGLIFLATIIQEISDAMSSRVDKIESDSSEEEEAETIKEPSVSIQDETNVSIQDDTKSLIRNTSIKDNAQPSITDTDGRSQNGKYGPSKQISNQTKEVEDSRL